jgi:hypothetical protein
MENNSATLRVHNNFKKRVMNFIKEYEKINNIKISTTNATKLIDDKIENAGGLVL